VIDLETLDGALIGILSRLEGTILNDLPGLEIPTMENIAEFIFKSVSVLGIDVQRVQVTRESLGQSVILEV
jgi:6-pyruvoyltetrahydropterin/6-carboxytetrahydropterin synthase